MKKLNRTLQYSLALFILLSPMYAISADMRGIKRLEIKDKTGTTVGLYKESHALVIGVSDYNNGWPKLPGVNSDIKAVSRALRANGFHVVTVKNPNSQALEKAFKDFIKKYGNKPENRLLFYFAGHGATVKPSWGGDPIGYIVPTDAPNPNRHLENFKDKALPMQRIEEYALNMDAKHGLFLFDSCFSGSLFAFTRAIPENITYKTAKPVRQFITAGTADEKVPDKSIFRQQFITALQGEGDLDKDGYMSATELGEFLQKTVINYSRSAQHPQYGKIRNRHLDKGDFVFTLPKKAQPRPIQLAGAGTGIADSQENRFWDSINKTDLDELKDYLSEYPQGHYARIARTRIKKLQKKPVPAPVIPQKARLTIRSNVYGDEVWLNGENKGTTRLDLKLNAGIYDLVIKKAGYEDYQRELQLDAGQAQVIYGRLTPKPAETTPYQAPIQRQSNANQGERISHYVVYNNGTVKDTKTGLLWKRCAEGLSGADCTIGKAKKYTLNNAVKQFKNVRYAGMSGWRLPTIKELNTLVYCSNGTKIKYKKNGYWSIKYCFDGGAYQKPTINQVVFPNATPNAIENNWRYHSYWSSSPSVYYPDNAWSVDFEYGRDFNYRRSSELFVRLVRAGQ